MSAADESRSLVGGGGGSGGASSATAGGGGLSATAGGGGLTRRATTLTKRESIAAFKADLMSKENDASMRWFAAKSAFFGGLGGLLAGWDIGAIAGVMLQLTTEFKLADGQKELVASTMLMGALGGSVVSGALADRLGRRATILLSSAIFAVGSVVTASASSVGVLYGGRVFTGVAVAVSTTADVMYLTEVAPLEWRGALTSCNELMTTLGILLAYSAGALADGVAGGWRILFGIPTLLALLQFVGMLGMPRSPRWLMERGWREEARDVFRVILVDEARVERELSAIEAELRRQRRAEERRKEERRGAGDEGGGGLCHRAGPELAVAVTMMVFSQWVGNANVLNYAPIILTKAGMGASASLAATVGLGVVKMLMTIVAIVSLETKGRRPLLLAGAVCCAVAMLMLGAAFTPTPPTVPLAVGGLVLFVAAWSASFGPLGWLLASELFTDADRGRAMSVATSVNWSANLGVSLTFLTISDALGQNNAFFMYAAVASAALLFIFVWVPETMGKTIGEIQREVRAKPGCGCCCGGGGGGAPGASTLLEEGDDGEEGGEEGASVQ